MPRPSKQALANRKKRRDAVTGRIISTKNLDEGLAANLVEEEEFRNNPLRQNDIFSNQMILESKERTSVSASENNDPVHALLQRCVPILEEKIKCMHQDISARINEQAASQSRINDFFTRLASGQATVSLTINFPGLAPDSQQPEQITTMSIPHPHSNQAESSAHSNPELNSDNKQKLQSTSPSVPLYRMSRGIVSITDLWREWSEGLCGGYAVVDLERRWGAKWRKEEKEKKFFYRRKLIIHTIEKYAAEKNISLRTAVEIAERKRSQKGYSLHWLANNKSEIFDD